MIGIVFDYLGGVISDLLIQVERVRGERIDILKLIITIGTAIFLIIIFVWIYSVLLGAM